MAVRVRLVPRDLTPFVKEGDNLVKVTLDNPGESSRWYPGGGIYRNVYLTKAGPAGVAQWGTFVSTKGNDVSIGITLRNAGKAVGGTVRTEIVRVINPGSSVTGPVEVVVDGKTRKAIVTKLDAVTDGGEVIQKFTLKDARFWSPETPELYQAVTTVTTRGGGKDVYLTTFGLRDLEYKTDGLYVNGQRTFIKGVCLHHDAGALGAAWNETAWVRRLNMLRQMGCNAIRTSHNPPAPNSSTSATGWDSS